MKQGIGRRRRSHQKPATGVFTIGASNNVSRVCADGHVQQAGGVIHRLGEEGKL